MSDEEPRDTSRRKFIIKAGQTSLAVTAGAAGIKLAEASAPSPQDPQQQINRLERELGKIDQLHEERLQQLTDSLRTQSESAIRQAEILKKQLELLIPYIPTTVIEIVPVSENEAGTPILGLYPGYDEHKGMKEIKDLVNPLHVPEGRDIRQVTKEEILGKAEKNAVQHAEQTLPRKTPFQNA